MQTLTWLFFLPFALQIAIIFLDEYLFHLKRNLPKWERIGHPLDTLSVLVCLLFALLASYSPGHIKLYVVLAIFSCIFVTKDEFVHKQHCPASEQWLHALLFINHPIVLICTYLMWKQLHAATPISWMPASALIQPFLLMQVIMATLFMLYQIIYWNWLRTRTL